MQDILIGGLPFFHAPKSTGKECNGLPKLMDSDFLAGHFSGKILVVEADVATFSLQRPLEPPSVYYPKQTNLEFFSFFFSYDPTPRKPHGPETWKNHIK